MSTCISLLYRGRALSSQVCFTFKRSSTTEVYSLSLHDALPISAGGVLDPLLLGGEALEQGARDLVHEPRAATVDLIGEDRKSTRLNSSHVEISYAVFCLKKKKLNNSR